MKTITVFTPTFNRAHLLPRLYESLCRQSCQDFLWLVIDDGSSDGTDELVKKWQAEKRIPIEYHFKENGGMHTGHNMAIKNIKTELCMCVDSDDYLNNDSIELILNLVDQYKVLENENLAGIIGLNETPNDKIIGNPFPEDFLTSKYQDIAYIHKATGDKKIVFKSKNLKELDAYPTFPPEKFVPLYHPILLDAKYDYLCFNKVFCVVEYQDDGSTINIYNQYFKNPKGFRHSRKIEMLNYKNTSRKFKSAIHQVSSNLILKEINLIRESPNILLSTFAIPFGIVLYLYTLSKRNTKRNINRYIIEK